MKKLFLTPKTNKTTIPIVQYANETTQFYVNHARELSKPIKKAHLEMLMNKCDAQEAEIAKKDLLNSELMVMIGELKETNLELKEKLLATQKKSQELIEEGLMNKKALELANDHILELQLENNLITSYSSKH